MRRPPKSRSATTGGSRAAGFWPRARIAQCLLLAIALACAPVLALAQGVPAVKAALQRMAPGVKIGHISKAPLPGFYQALVGGRLVYVSADGTWIMDGHLYNASTRIDLSARAMRDVRRAALATLPASDFLVFAPAHPKYSVTVFTDLDCPYCRVFHQHIKQINAEGIAVRYLFWPRAGIKAYPSGTPTPTYLKSVAVWCAPERKAAFTAAKQGKAIPAASCDNPVAAEYRLGASIGVDGTPTIIASDGTELGGYLPPAQLLQALQKVRERNDGSR